MAVGAMIWKESLDFLNLNVLLNSKFSALFNSTKLGKRCQYIVAKGQTVLGHLFIEKNVNRNIPFSHTDLSHHVDCSGAHF